MCSYLTVPAEVTGSAKGPDGWFSITSASVYFDHPFHAPLEHSLAQHRLRRSGTGTTGAGGGGAERRFSTRTREVH
jgi:hypothetical protein